MIQHLKESLCQMFSVAYAVSGQNKAINPQIQTVLTYMRNV